MAAATEPWGVLGLPVLVLAPSTWVALRGAVAALLGAAAAYLPFAATGSFSLPRHQWPVGADSLVHALAPGLVTFGWPLRLAQGALALGAGAAVAWLVTGAVRSTARSHGQDGIWLVPLAATAGRLVLDPVATGYYWWTALLLSLAGVALARRGALPVATVAAALAWWNAVDPGRTPLGALLVTLPLAALAAAPPRAAGLLAARVGDRFAARGWSLTGTSGP